MANLALAIEFIGVDKRFGRPGTTSEVLAAREVNFSVAVGEVVSIIGPSGCGKSTLLNMGSGLAMPNAGTVKVAGEVVNGPNKHVAFMLQKDLLVPCQIFHLVGHGNRHIQELPQTAIGRL